MIKQIITCDWCSKETKVNFWISVNSMGVEIKTKDLCESCNGSAYTSIENYLENKGRLKL